MKLKKNRELVTNRFYRLLAFPLFLLASQSHSPASLFFLLCTDDSKHDSSNKRFHSEQDLAKIHPDLVQFSLPPS
ncbi:hypothetical protein P8452_33872 [Trifolium repens]|nr:hypothetical protein P8452_33872 [Trifolium repens]